jgi:ribosomal protein S18 acetylase RimI-like enzyme
LFPECQWYAAADDHAVVLLFAAHGTPVLLPVGDPEHVAPLLDEVEAAQAYLSLRPGILPLIEARWRLEEIAPMWRMVLNPALQSDPTAQCQRLDMSDVEALGRLYDDGRETGEVPDFFRLSMVREGVFFGVFEGADLVAAAGTHLAVPAEGVGAVGNVYTRRDRRGRGLATATTAAVAAELLRMGVRTVALNVSRDNPAAIRAYERAGFRIHCPFYEGFAARQ